MSHPSVHVGLSTVQGVHVPGTAWQRGAASDPDSAGKSSCCTGGSYFLSQHATLSQPFLACCDRSTQAPRDELCLIFNSKRSSTGTDPAGAQGSAPAPNLEKGRTAMASVPSACARCNQREKILEHLGTAQVMPQCLSLLLQPWVSGCSCNLP